MSSAVVLGTGSTFEPPVVRGKFDAALDLIEVNQQSLVKALRLALEWTKVLSPGLGLRPSFSNALSVLTTGDNIFTLSDTTSNVRAFINNFRGKPTFASSVEAVADVANSVCEVVAWLHTFKVIELATKIFNRVCFISGLTMMVSFGHRAYTLAQKAQTAPLHEQSFYYWETLRHASFVALGLFYALSSVTTISPMFLLISSTSTLIAHYGAHISKTTAATVTLETQPSGAKQIVYSVNTSRVATFSKA